MDSNLINDDFLGESSFVNGTAGNVAYFDEDGLPVHKDVLAAKRAIEHEYLRRFLPALVKGSPITSIRKDDGNKLSYSERSILMNMLPVKYNPYKSGRFFERHSNGHITDTGYHCNHNLAGQFFVATRDGVVQELTIPVSDSECGHKYCQFGKKLRAGGATDKICMVIDKNFADLPKGIFSVAGAGSRNFWRGAYHQAVMATRLMFGTCTPKEILSVLGTQYRPSSTFGSVIVFMARMLGLQNVGFFQCTKYPDIVANAAEGSTEASVEFTKLWDRVGVNHRQPVPRNAWALHHMCRLRAVYPGIEIPYEYYLRNIDNLRGNVNRTLGLITRAYEQGGVYASVFDAPPVKSEFSDLQIAEQFQSNLAMPSGVFAGSSRTLELLFCNRVTEGRLLSVRDLEEVQVRHLNFDVAMCAEATTKRRILSFDKTVLKSRNKYKNRWREYCHSDLLPVMEVDEHDVSGNVIDTSAPSMSDKLKTYSAHESLVIMASGLGQ